MTDSRIPHWPCGGGLGRPAVEHVRHTSLSITLAETTVVGTRLLSPRRAQLPPRTSARPCLDPGHVPTFQTAKRAARI